MRHLIHNTYDDDTYIIIDELSDSENYQYNQWIKKPKYGTTVWEKVEVREHFDEELFEI